MPDLEVILLMFKFHVCSYTSAVILEPTKIKSPTVSLSICHEVMGPNAMILVF